MKWSSTGIIKLTSNVKVWRPTANLHPHNEDDEGRIHLTVQWFCIPLPSSQHIQNQAGPPIYWWYEYLKKPSIARESLFWMGPCFSVFFTMTYPYESCKLIYNEFVYIYHGSQQSPGIRIVSISLVIFCLTLREVVQRCFSHLTAPRSTFNLQANLIEIGVFHESVD